MTRRALFPILLALAGCPQATVQPIPGCDVLLVPSVPGAGVGETVELTGGPFSEVYDTTLHVAGVEADILDVDVSDCEDCRSCRAETGCEVCGACAPCDDVCACTERVTFVVPEVDAGRTRLLMFNRWGTSLPADFEVIPTEAPVE